MLTGPKCSTGCNIYRCVQFGFVKQLLWLDTELFMINYGTIHRNSQHSVHITWQMCNWTRSPCVDTSAATQKRFLSYTKSSLVDPKSTPDIEYIMPDIRECSTIALLRIRIQGSQEQIPSSQNCKMAYPI